MKRCLTKDRKSTKRNYKKKKKRNSGVQKYNYRNEKLTRWNQQHISTGKRIRELEEMSINIIHPKELKLKRMKEMN